MGLPTKKRCPGSNDFAKFDILTLEYDILVLAKGPEIGQPQLTGRAIEV
jgi:hypothetical protein